MSLLSDRLPIADNFVVNAERASLFSVLQAALRRRWHPEELRADFMMIWACRRANGQISTRIAARLTTF